MKVNKLRIAAITGAGLLLFSVLAVSGSDSLITKITPFGYGSFQFGEIMQGNYPYVPGDITQIHCWTQEGLLQIGVKAERNDGWSIFLAGEGSVTWPPSNPSEGGATGGGFTDVYTQIYSWYFHQAEVRYSIGDSKANWPADPANTSPFQIDLGFFPFKYNSDARDFGEYLFRIQSYPQYLVTDFDTPYERLLGLRVSSTLGGVLRQDLLLTSEAFLWPLQDFSLTYLVDYNIKYHSRKFAEIGGGIMADRVFSVNSNITTPPVEDNPLDLTFASTKVMLKASLNIKAFMPDFPKAVGLNWGENDLKLYSEMCINGVDNYKLDSASAVSNIYINPLWDNIKKRMPVMIGFDFPTFNLLDVLSVEAEWWNNDFADSYLTIYLYEGYNEEMIPLPDQYNSSALNYYFPKAGPWSWSVYAERHLAKNINFKFQIARDHTFFPVALQNKTYGDPYADLAGKGDWAWMSKIEYSF